MTNGSTQTEMPVAAAARNIFGQRILEMADHLAHWSESATELTCTYLSPAHRAVAGQLRHWMTEAGMTADIDMVGNVVGRYASAESGAKSLIIGSHYDTVRNAGKYDGRLGILTGLAVIEHLARTHQKLPFHLELIAFSEEEGARFGTGYLGSSAIAGRFDKGILDRCDAGGLSVGDLICSIGGNLDDIPKLARRPDSLLGYLEVHIEQGPVLLHDNLPVGIVTAIAGCARHLVTVKGVAGHAGTVPMAARHDAAAAAAEIVLLVERRCRQTPGIVGTVGRLSIPNAAINVIPERCDLSFDIRGDDTAKRNAAIADIFAEMQNIAKRRGVKVEATEIQNTPAVACSPRLQKKFAEAVARAGIRPCYLPSGAGHDAVCFDGLTELAMLFVRCGNGGVSHSPLETVTVEDADVAAKILLDVILRFHAAD